jgi:hypothetical protein
MKPKKVLLASVGALCAIVGAADADAASLLYRVDYLLDTDYLGAAIYDSGYGVTSTSGSLGGFDLSDYDVVVYANQGGSLPNGDVDALNAYIAAGGKVIFDDWTRSNSFNGGQIFTGATNHSSVTLSQFYDGVPIPMTLSSPGWGIFSTDMAAAPGSVVAATFENGAAAIVVGNGGRTIVNGFLSDTAWSEALYANELASFAALPSSPTPEPASWAMMVGGFGLVGGALRSRRKAAVRFG